MTHETSVHHADAAFTAGTPFALDADLAADAITESLELLSSVSAAEHKPELAELRGRGETLRLCPVERSLHDWLITREGHGAAFEHGTAVAEVEADVTVRGPVRDLLLVLARRLDPAGAEVEVTGDRSLLDHWLAHTAI